MYLKNTNIMSSLVVGWYVSYQKVCHTDNLTGVAVAEQTKEEEEKSIKVWKTH
jgi:hypothetical protein